MAVQRISYSHIAVAMIPVSMILHPWYGILDTVSWIQYHGYSIMDTVSWIQYHGYIHDTVSMIPYPWYLILIPYSWYRIHDTASMIPYPWYHIHDTVSMIPYPRYRIHDTASMIPHPWYRIHHQIQLRNIGDLRIPLYTATQSQLFVRYRAINTWNSLSGDLRSSSSLCTFRNKLLQLYLTLT